MKKFIVSGDDADKYYRSRKINTKDMDIVSDNLYSLGSKKPKSVIETDITHRLVGKKFIKVFYEYSWSTINWAKKPYFRTESYKVIKPNHREITVIAENTLLCEMVRIEKDSITRSGLKCFVRLQNHNFDLYSRLFIEINEKYANLLILKNINHND